MSAQASRPLQIESLGAAILTTFGHPGVITTHGSQNIAGHGAVGAVSAAVGATVVVALWLAFARGPATRARCFATPRRQSSRSSRSARCCRRSTCSG